MKISTRLLLLFLLLSVLPLAIFSYFNFRQDEESLREAELDEMSNLADKKTTQVNSYLAERVQDVSLLVRGTRVMAAIDTLPAAYAVGSDTARYRKEDAVSRQYFQRYVEELGIFYDVFLITPQGEIIYTQKHETDFSTNLLTGPERESQLAWAFRAVRMTLEPVISGFELYAPSGAPAMFIAAPIMLDGRFKGVFAVQLGNELFYRVANDATGLGISGEIAFARRDDGGATYTTPLRHQPDAAMKLKLSKQQLDKSPMLNALSGDAGEGMKEDYRGKQVLAAWRYLPGLDWGMVVKIDADEVFAPIYEQLTVLLETLFGVLLFTGLIAYYFGRQLTEPLNRLAHVADGVSKGDMGGRGDESAPGELGLFARSFNRMAENLQALYRTLEDRVEERTRELNVSNEQLQEEIIEREHIEKSLIESQTQTLNALNEVRQKQAALEINKKVLDTTKDGFWLTDAQGNLQMANQGYADISGYAIEELEHMHISQLEAKEKSIDEVKAHIEKIIAQGSDQFETLHRRKDGSIVDIEITTSFLRGTQQFAVFARDISERKRLNDEIKEQKEQYDHLASNIPVGVYLLQTSASGKFDFKYVSPRFCAMLGVTAAAVYAGSGEPFKVIHPEDLPDFIRLNQEVVQTGKPFLWEGRSLVQGNVRWLQIESKAETLRNGDFLWYGVMTDITERHLVQMDLQHKQEMLNEAQRLGQLGSWELNLVTGELSWSDEIYRMFELDPAQFKPSYENFLNVIHPDDRDKVNLAYTQSLKDRQPYDVLHRLLFADGRIKWVREHCNSDFDASGKPLRSVGAVQDITEQKLAENSLRVAAATFETHEGIMITDAQSNILRVNKAFQEITGFSADEVLGKNPRVLSSGRQSKEFYAEMWLQLLDEGAWSGEIWDKRKNGEIYPKWLTITAVKDPNRTTTEYVAIFSDITARKRAEEEIRNLAFYDALTGLPNRRLLLDRAHLALSVSARSHNCGALLFLDMDKFKTLNDTLGHDYGDQLLVEVGRRIQACVREVDTVARLGGDEFVVLVEEVSANMQEASQKVALIAEKIRLALGQPYRLNDHEIHSSPSIGVSVYRGSIDSVDTLMKQADMAMYKAKDSGRNAVRFFDPLMQQSIELRAQMDYDLREALPNRQLQLHYQIQVDSEHRPIGAEALIRWRHPGRGMVPPIQFIPIAEESSLILDIGHWVMDTACQQLAEWDKDEQMRYLLLAVNVSAHQFRLHDFVGRVEELIVKHGIVPERLKLELTESVVLEDIADVAAKMHALKALGVRLSLDDFGTGYSSLAYLKQLPLDQIKIDQSFVRDITSDLNDAVMVKTIISMAKNFRLNVIAEGVETEAQLAFLKQNECMAYQGYLFSRPVPLAEFEALARRLIG